ncbi:MAG: STAS domain-containing protein [Rickettsiella sp.]|nr:STAS domain-containing protein [Rickettsiella sp.]
MNTWTFQRKNDNTYTLSGTLTYETVPAIWQQSQNTFKDLKHSVTFDLSEVTQSDSSGVALLISWIRNFHRQSQTVYFTYLPSQMLAIIQLAGLNTIVPTKK